MNTFLDLALQDPGSLGLVEVGDLEQLGCVQPSIALPSHNQLLANNELEDRSASCNIQFLARSSHSQGRSIADSHSTFDGHQGVDAT